MEDYYDHTQKTIKVDPIRVQLLSYRLLSLFFASEKLHIACSGECNSGADYFASNFEKVEIEHTLLNIATLFRTADTNAINGRTFYDRWNPVVGELVVDSKDNYQMTLREACNKIIHSKEIKYEIQEGEYEWNRFLQPTIYLYGEHNKIGWRAIIDIQLFCFQIVGMPE